MCKWWNRHQHYHHQQSRQLQQYQEARGGTAEKGSSCRSSVQRKTWLCFWTLLSWLTETEGVFKDDCFSQTITNSPTVFKGYRQCFLIVFEHVISLTFQLCNPWMMPGQRVLHCEKSRSVSLLFSSCLAANNRTRLCQGVLLPHVILHENRPPATLTGHF